MSWQRVTLAQNGLPLAGMPKTIPQNGVSSLFTVQGKIRVVQLVGEVTTAIAGGANNAKLQFKPTGQTAVDMCAVADIGTAPLAIGQLLSVVGPVATALSTGWLATGASTNPIISSGTIDLNCAAAAGTGAIRWTLIYLPLANGVAYVL
jgi:hypothetical protein